MQTVDDPCFVLRDRGDDKLEVVAVCADKATAVGVAITTCSNRVEERANTLYESEAWKLSERIDPSPAPDLHTLLRLPIGWTR